MVNRDAVDESAPERHTARPVRRHALVVGLVATSALAAVIGAGPAGALERLPGPWHRDSSAAVTTNTDRGDDADERSCTAATAPRPTTTAPAPVGASSVSQTVTVVVPPIVRVESDRDGALAVITNAARPPAPGDQVYRLQADGNYAPADETLVARVMSSRWADDSWCSTTAVHLSSPVDDEDHHEDEDDDTGEDDSDDR